MSGTSQWNPRTLWYTDCAGHTPAGTHLVSPRPSCPSSPRPQLKTASPSSCRRMDDVLGLVVSRRLQPAATDAAAPPVLAVHCPDISLPCSSFSFMLLLNLQFLFGLLPLFSCCLLVFSCLSQMVLRLLFETYCCVGRCERLYCLSLLGLVALGCTGLHCTGLYTGHRIPSIWLVMCTGFSLEVV